MRNRAAAASIEPHPTQLKSPTASSNIRSSSRLVPAGEGVSRYGRRCARSCSGPCTYVCTEKYLHPWAPHARFCMAGNNSASATSYSRSRILLLAPVPCLILPATRSATFGHGSAMQRAAPRHLSCPDAALSRSLCSLLHAPWLLSPIMSAWSARWLIPNFQMCQHFFRWRWGVRPPGAFAIYCRRASRPPPRLLSCRFGPPSQVPSLRGV